MAKYRKGEHFLSELQQLQDNGNSWGRSLRMALDYVIPKTHDEHED